MASYSQLADCLVREARNHRHSEAFIALRDRFCDQPINYDVATHLIDGLIKLASVVLPEVTDVLRKRGIEWAIIAAESIQRNRHMNNAGGMHLVNNFTADALLVDYVNYACVPLDLGFYTADLYS